MTVDEDDREPVEPPPGHDCHDDGPVPRGEASAEQRGWGPGWPADNRHAMRAVRSGGIALSVRAELAPLVAHLVTETVDRGYALRHGECWGFANRAIAGTNRPSNHSWGLAVDLNATTNPMGPDLVTDMPDWMVERWTSRGFRWGGHYRGRKDSMHFEYMGSPADLHAELAAIVDAPAPLDPPPDATPWPGPGPTLRRGARGPDVARLQERLNAHGAALAVDGDFGPRTDAAVRAFQSAHGLVVDGIVGPLTWGALG
jgi:hypothetical protein